MLNHKLPLSNQKLLQTTQLKSYQVELNKLTKFITEFRFKQTTIQSTVATRHEK